MTEEAMRLVLEHLGTISASLERVEGDLSNITLRMSCLDGHLGQVLVQMAGQNSRMDRFASSAGSISSRRTDKT